MDMRIGITQTQKQTISPVIMQTLELLTIPTIELAERLEEEAEINPIIELEYKKDKEKKSGDLDEEIENKFQDSSDIGYQKPTRKTKSSSDFDSQAFLENLSYEKADLTTHLMEQIHFLPFSSTDKEIASIIITSLDKDGFLRVPQEELLKNSDYSPEQFENVRKRIQQLEPMGVASLNLQEFLKVQVEYEFGTNSLEFSIINDYIELLEKKLFTKLAKKLDVTFEEIEQAIDNIKQLHVFPATNFSREVTRYIIPDAKVEVEEYEIKLTLNDEYIPNVKLNQFYIDLYSNTKKTNQKETKNFLKENIERAKILIENLKSRKEIIFKVILKIIEKQRDFFLKGEQHQVPLKLRDIADELEVHESTVSRAIKEKYIQTERGIISLKSFFSTHVGSDDVSANSVREILKRIIEVEDKNNPLSDDKIVRILKNKGVSISRRTVAKYRGELNIPAAYIRRNPL